MSENLRATGDTCVVTFENTTAEAVTFIMMIRGNPSKHFTVPQYDSHQQTVNVGVPVSHETLHMVVGEDSTGTSTNNSITSDVLAGLEKVTITKDGNEFKLELHKRNRKTRHGNLFSILTSWFCTNGPSELPR